MLDEGSEPHFGGGQRRCDQLAFGDVQDLRHEPGGRPIRVASHGDVQFDPHELAVLVDVALHHLVLVARPDHALLEQLEIEFKIIRVRDGLERRVEQFDGGVAEHRAQRRVDAQEMSVGVDEGDTNRCSLERQSKVLLAGPQAFTGGGPFRLAPSP